MLDSSSGRTGKNRISAGGLLQRLTGKNKGPDDGFFRLAAESRTSGWR
jgi:hypothetical protein